VKKISMENLRHAAEKDSSLWHAALAAGQLDGGRMNLLFTDEVAATLGGLELVEVADEPAGHIYVPASGSPAPNRIAAGVAARPRLVAWISRHKIAGETGVGDTLARWFGGRQGKQFAAWVARLGGTTCGCTDAQQWLNQVFPYVKAPLSAP
jgi:hypothetical protein